MSTGLSVMPRVEALGWRVISRTFTYEGDNESVVSCTIVAQRSDKYCLQYIVGVARDGVAAEEVLLESALRVREPRARIDQWWELEDRHGNRVEYAVLARDASIPPVPQRFTETDLTDKCIIEGTTEIDRVREEFKEEGPLKLIKVTRYKLKRR